MNFTNYEGRTYLNILIKGREDLLGKKKANHILAAVYCIKSKEEVNQAFQKKKKKFF